MLDTNSCIYLLKQRPPQVAMRFAECYEGEVVISTVTLAELRYGVRCCPPETRAQNEAALNALLEVIPAWVGWVEERNPGKWWATLRFCPLDLT